MAIDVTQGIFPTNIGDASDVQNDSAVEGENVAEALDALDAGGGGGGETNVSLLNNVAYNTCAILDNHSGAGQQIGDAIFSAFEDDAAGANNASTHDVDEDTWATANPGAKAVGSVAFTGTTADTVTSVKMDAVELLDVEVELSGSPAELLIHGNQNGSSEFIDSSEVVGKTITSVGDVSQSLVDPKFGLSCIEFDGTGDALTVPDDAAWHLATSAFTTDIWAKPSSIVSSMLIGQGSGSDSLKRAWWLFENADGSIGGRLYTSGGVAPMNISSAVGSLVAGEWQHLAMCRPSSTGLYLFIDGFLVVRNTSLVVNVFDTAEVLSVGDLSGTSAGDEYVGKMDEIHHIKGSFTYPIANVAWQINVNLDTVIEVSAGVSYQYVI